MALERVRYDVWFTMTLVYRQNRVSLDLILSMRLTLSLTILSLEP
jgi:hypothetical protein